jgi:hypothetical protein
MLTAKKRPKPIVKVEPEEITDPSIPEDRLLEFIGNTPYFLKVDQHFIWNNSFRINVWSQKFEDGRVCPTNRIEKSFYVQYNGYEILDKSR